MARVRAVGWSLIALPTDSLELNPAERVFEELRRDVEGKVYASSTQILTASVP